MAKAKNILGYAFNWLTKGDADKLEQVKAFIEETVKKAVSEAIGELLTKAEVGKSLFEALKQLTEKKVLEGAEENNGGVAQQAESADAAPEAEPKAEDEPQATAAEPALSWCYGGFNGSKAKVSGDAVLESATLKGDTLTIKWKTGGCEQLGATSETDADHTVACMFLADGAGGKFEWISTSRKTRNMKNIKKGYNGWPPTALDGGGRLWFCIAGVKDDKKTSNGKRTACVEVQRA